MKFFLFATVVMSLVGCEIFGGGTAPKNTLEVVLETKAIAKAYTLSIQSLANRCIDGIPPSCRQYAISRTQALEQLAHIEVVDRSLRDAVLVVSSSGDPLAGGDILIRVNSTLTLVLTFLASQEQR